MKIQACTSRYSGMGLAVVTALTLSVMNGLTAQARSFGVDYRVERNRVPGESVRVEVLDEATGLPLQGATVRLEDSELPGLLADQYWTDSQGEVRLTGPNSQMYHLAAFKRGYTGIKVFGIQARSIKLILKQRPQASDWVTASGSIQNFPRRTRGRVQAGLAFRALDSFDLMSFQLSTIISPLKDTIQVFGERQVPSNLVLPRQSVSIGFIPISLNKPNYRFPMVKGNDRKLVGIQGTMDKDKIARAVRGGGFSFGILNDLRMERIALGQIRNVTGDYREALSGTRDLSLFHTVNAKAAPFQANILNVAIADFSQNRSILVPFDVKTAQTADGSGSPRSTRLASDPTISASSRGVMTLAVSGDYSTYSGIVTQPAGRTVNPGQFLSPAKMRRMGLPTEVILQAPSTGIAMATISSEIKAMNGKVTQEDPIWRLFVMPSGGSQAVVPRDFSEGETIKRVSVTRFDFGSTFSERRISGSEQMRSLKRFSRKISKSSRR